MDLASLGAILASIAVVATALNGWFQRKDTGKQNKDVLAWDIVKTHMSNLQKEYDKLEKKYEDSEIDRGVQKRQMDELSIKHHDCEKGRKELEVQVQVLKIRVDELRGER